MQQPGQRMIFNSSRDQQREDEGASLRKGPVDVTAKPHWLFIDLAPDFGGHEVMLLRWIEELQRQDEVETSLVCASGTRLARLGTELLPTTEVDIANGSLVNKAVRFSKLALQLHALKRARRPSLALIAEGCLMSQRHGLFAARLVGLRSVVYVPLVSSFSDMGFSDAARLERRMRSFYRKLPKAWLTITPQQADELRSWSGIKQSVFCLPNTVSSDKFQRAGETPGQGDMALAGSRPLKVLVLGRLDSHQKGLDCLLQHLKDNPALAVDIHVSLIGEGPYLPTLQAALRDDPALAQLVALEGWQDPSTALAGHDVLLIASRFEGVPLVMLEAMASGVPVVATDLPGTRPYLPLSCLFQFGDFDRAFDIIRSLRDPAGLRETVVQMNLASFARQASPAAFGLGVRQLTAQLSALD